MNRVRVTWGLLILLSLAAFFIGGLFVGWRAAVCNESGKRWVSIPGGWDCISADRRPMEKKP